MTILKGFLRALPDRVAFFLVSRVAAKSQRPPVSPTQQQALEQATKIRYGDGVSNVAWSWGRGPLVIFVHGWNGRAAQMAPMAVEVAKSGYRCVAIEVTGHGSSPGSKTGWSCFIEDIAALQRSIGGEVYAYVGHSAGALTMMAARVTQRVQASLYICICAPSHPYPPINVIRQKLDPKPGVIARYRNYIANQFGLGWEQLETGSAYLDVGSELLLFYDKTDRYISHGDGDIIKAWCPESTLIKTTGYSHGKILTAPELVHSIKKFLHRS